MRATLLAIALSTTALAGCATMAPKYERPALPVAQVFPNGGQEAKSAGDLAWREVFQDARLQKVIDLALLQNRDLRVAVANIERARAQYRVQRAQLYPAVNATLSENRARVPAGVSQF